MVSNTHWPIYSQVLLWIPHSWRHPLPNNSNYMERCLSLEVYLFNWLTWGNRILTLENLAARNCNRLLTSTYVLYHAASEFVHHLLLLCPVADCICHFFTQVVRLSSPPRSLHDLCGTWRTQIPHSHRGMWNLLSRAITWNIWLEKNTCIFHDKFSACSPIINIIIYMFVSWITLAP